MKKTLLFTCMVWLITAFSLTHGIQAQTWTAPALTGSTLATGTTYYVYNVGSNGYLNQGAQWGTMAAVTSLPIKNASANTSANIVKWTPVNTIGSTWTFQLNIGGSNVSGKFLFTPNSTTDGSVYTDGTVNNTWDVVLTDATNNIYSIQIVSTYTDYNATKYLGSALAAETTNKGIANSVRYNRASGDNYTQWKFASQADMDLYNAKVLLDKYMKYAKTRGGMDISSYITTYNAGVAADITAAAANLLTALGITSVAVPNFSFETDAIQTGWTKSGSWANQTNTPLFTKDGTNYTEKYIGSGSNLATGTITQTITGLANGLYGLVATGHAVQQAGSNPLHTGAFFTAGTSSTEISAGGDYNVDYVSVTNATSGSNGTLDIGYALSGTVACNWTGFDNFRLYYYGAIVTPTLTVSPKSLLTYLTPGTKKVAVTGLNLNNNITITAPAHFSVSPSTLLKTVAGDSVTITYDGGAAASGYVVFASGTTKDSIQVTGTAILTIAPSATSLFLDDVAFKDSITVSALNLTNNMTITAPAGITVSPVTIAAPGSPNVKVLITYDKTTSINGNIVLTSGALTVNVAVKASSNVTCYTPLYPSGNMIADPTFSAATLTAGGFGGWGPTAITHTRQYCGKGAAYIRGTCYPDGGSLDRALNTANGNALKPNTKYRLRAMVYSQASAGKTFQFQIEGVDGTTSQYFQIGNTNGWKQFDTTFVTGATVTEKGIYFNSCTNAPAITDTCFIDNYELFEAPGIAFNPKSLAFSGVSTKKVAVTALKLTNGITITAPTGFTVTPSTLLSTVAGDSVAITYGNAADVSGYVVFKSGSVKDSIQVTGTALSSDATLSALSISDGTLSPAFAPGTITYNVVVPVGTVVVPAITTVTTTESHATFVIAQTTSVPGAAMVVVTAQDGITKKTYTVNFTWGAPAAPIAAAATSVAKKSFSANWAVSTGATGYFLDVATDNAFTAFVIGYNNLNVGNATTYAVTDLAAATTYYYRVRATNGIVSANSNTISVLSLGTDVQSLAANGLGIIVTANAVELESSNAILSVQVVNVNGTLMAEKSVNATNATISTEGWASGIYVFTIKTQAKVITTKLGIVK